MKIVVAPDKFKGSLSSLEVAKAIERGIKKAVPEAEVVLCPLADGGEGTVEALVTATGGQIIKKRVTGPLGTPIDSYFGLLGSSVFSLRSSVSSVGIVEMAAASGLHLVPPERQNPLVTTTYGTGELINAALDEGCRKTIVGIGGSATTDGGMGMAQALGVKFLDHQGKVLGLGRGQLLQEIAGIDADDLDKRIGKTEFLVASDVQNPLTGPQGAAQVYAPQKGATPTMVKELDKGLSHYDGIIKRDLGIDIRDAPGAGAAGGLGAGLMVFLKAKLRSGVDLVMEAVSLEKKLQGADLVITGEGKIDRQTAYGKVPLGVARLAKAKNIPVIAIGGQVTEDAVVLKDYGITELYLLMKPGMSVEEAMKHASRLLEDKVAEVLHGLYETKVW